MDQKPEDQVVLQSNKGRQLMRTHYNCSPKVDELELVPKKLTEEKAVGYSMMIPSASAYLTPANEARERNKIEQIILSGGPNIKVTESDVSGPSEPHQSLRNNYNNMATSISSNFESF